MLHREIADLFNCKTAHISYLCKIYNIIEDMKKESYKLTPIQQDFIIGSLLGDGSLIKSFKSKYPYFKVSHNEDQLNYLKYKIKLLGSISKNDKIYKYQNSKFLHRKPMYMFHTKSLPVLEGYYNMNNIELMANINLNSLLIWYLDDGNILRGRYFGIVCARFNMEELNHLISNLKKVFKVNPKIVWSKREKNGHQGFKLNKEDTIKILKLFEKSYFYDEVFDMFKYKLIP